MESEETATSRRAAHQYAFHGPDSGTEGQRKQPQEQILN